VGLQLFLWAALIFILLGLLFSKSRAGIAGAFLGFVSFVMLAHMGGRRFSWPAWAAMGAGLGLLLFYGSVIGFEEIIGRFLMIDENAGSRINIWKDTWVMIKDHPLGVGLRNYEAVMPVYNAHGPLGLRFAQAHNDYLQILAEVGWPGFICVVGGFFVFLGAFVRRIWKNGAEMDAVRFFIGIGAVSGLISMAFHSFFDFNLQIPANLVYFAVLVGLAGCLTEDGRQRTEEY
jgi:O-antigen ligase